MDNCFTGRRDRSRQTPEKDVIYILPAGPVTECAFARWRIVLPSCLDSVAESAGIAGPSLVQATSDAVPPRGDEIQQNATQPVEAPGAGTATQPVKAPGAGPEVLPSGTGDAALSADQTLTSLELPSVPVGPRVKMNSIVRPVPSWKETTGMVPQPETSPGTSLQIKSPLRRSVIERQ